MNIKSIQTIGKASYNLCSMVLATAAASAISIFGTVGQAQANNSLTRSTTPPINFRVEIAEEEPITFPIIIFNSIQLNRVTPVTPVAQVTPVTPVTSVETPVTPVETPEPSLILGFIAVGGLMLGSTRKAKD